METDKENIEESNDNIGESRVENPEESKAEGEESKAEGGENNVQGEENKVEGEENKVEEEQKEVRVVEEPLEFEEQFKDIVEALASIKSQDGSTNLLAHLQEMNRVKIELNDDCKYNDLFEDISIRLKSNGYYLNEKAHIEALQKYLEDFKENIKKSRKLLEPPVKIEGEETTPITQVNYVPDYHTLFKQISWCGISLSEKESYLLRNSLRNLSGNLPGTVSFFGKIYGTKRDYYVAEATEVDPPEGFEYPPDMEQRKNDGVNKNVFFVTNDLSEDWKELPDVTADQIVASRKIRYNFTGDLERKIYTNPHFNGQEKHLLHCQLSRIYHGTKLVPTLNNYTVESPEEPFKPLVPNTDNKPKKFTHNDLINLGTWIHYPPGILKQGRVNHFIETPEEEQDPEEFRKKQMEKDPFDKRIKPITEDKLLSASSLSKIKICPWKLSQCYENNIYVNPYIKLLDETQPDFEPTEQKDNKADYTIICIKSLLWPGAYNFYLGKECYFFYFGNGQKFINTETDGPFVYKDFPKIPSDENDFEDQPEPTLEPKDPNAEGEEGEGGENKEEAKEGEGAEE